MNWKTYTDGAGNPIPNEDEILRQKLFAKFSTSLIYPYLQYTGNVRAGTIIYTEQDLTIEFYHELAGGDYKMYINIPDENDWEKATKTPLERRDEIIKFVAESVCHDKAPSWQYKINEQEILFY